MSDTFRRPDATRHGATMTDGLIEFLTARLDEDEKAAQDAGGKAWSWDQGYGTMCNDPTCPFGALVTDDTVVMEVHGYDVHVGWEGGPHIERHHPARVLAEVKLKRRMSEASNVRCTAGCQTAHSFSGSCALRWMGPAWDTPNGRWVHDVKGEPAPAPPVVPVFVLQLLALPYADHPDYLPEWAVSE